MMMGNIMPFPQVSKRQAYAISNGVFFILLGILFYTDAWWPGILIAVGIMLTIRQYLTQRTVDLLITLVILAIIVLISITGIAFSVLLPLLFILGGLYIIFREYFFIERTRLETSEKPLKRDFEDDDE